MLGRNLEKLSMLFEANEPGHSVGKIDEIIEVSSPFAGLVS
jgi:hypothetical protein